MCLKFSNDFSARRQSLSKRSPGILGASIMGESGQNPPGTPFPHNQRQGNIAVASFKTALFEDGVQTIARILLALSCFDAKLSSLDFPLKLLLSSHIVSARLRFPQIGPDLVWRNEPLVLVDNGSAKRSFLDDDGGKHESRPYLHQVDLRVSTRYRLGLR